MQSGEGRRGANVEARKSMAHGLRSVALTRVRSPRRFGRGPGRVSGCSASTLIAATICQVGKSDVLLEAITCAVLDGDISR